MYCLSRHWGDFSTRCQKATSKNHPKDILCDEIYLMKTLCTIADRTTPRSWVPRNIARKNLLQQLSVASWMNNARMILRYWALQVIDIDDNPLFP